MSTGTHHPEPGLQGSRPRAGVSSPEPLPSCLGQGGPSTSSPQGQPLSAFAPVLWEHPAAHDSARPSSLRCSCPSRPNAECHPLHQPCLGGRMSPNCWTTLCLRFLTGEAADMPTGSDGELLGYSARHATASWPGFAMTWDAALPALRGG